MGSRMYILRKMGTWKAIYSHWGASRLKEYLQHVFLKDPRGDIDLTGCIERIVDDSVKEGEVFEDVNLETFIDLSDILIEAWVVDNGRDMYMILPFINNEIYGAIIAKVYDNAWDDYLTLSIYEKISNYIEICSHGIDSLGREEVINTAKRYFNKYFFEPNKFRYLVFDKIPLDVLNTMLGKSTIIYR